MAIKVKIPTSLRKLTANKDVVEVEASTVGEALRAVEAEHAGLLAKIVDDNAGKVRRFINVYAGDEDVRYLDGLDTAVTDGTEISIIPAIAGG
jgi:molybdopterin synthase sulfur carrier subunit